MCVCVCVIGVMIMLYYLVLGLINLTSMCMIGDFMEEKPRRRGRSIMASTHVVNESLEVRFDDNSWDHLMKMQQNHQL